MASWLVAGVRITPVVEFAMPFPVDFFAEATPADVAAERWLTPDFVDVHGRYLMSFRSLVLEADGRRIVVDTATGNAKSRPQIPEFDHRHRPFLAQLAAAGFAPDTIDTVVCTHLHLDHVGWNTRLVDDEWVPTFPRARHLFGAREVDYWARSTDPLHAPAFADSVRPVLEAGLVELIETDTALTPQLQLAMTPGHTPGHMSLWIGEAAVITGDVLHHPIQCRHPEWTARGDADPDTARATRGRLLAAVAATGALVFGTHFTGAGAGRVRSAAGGYRFIPEPPP